MTIRSSSFQYINAPFLTTQGRVYRDDTRSVAVVGTRRSSHAGISRTQRSARGLVERGVTVVSGLAAGIDTAAHRAALGAGGRTVAVIGTGIRRCYPPDNVSLQRMIEERGLVASQFWPDSPPSKQSFPMRNAVMSGYAAATVVVEAGHISGARIQARPALAHSRHVFLLRNLFEHEWTRDFAERPGTTVVDSVDQITEVVDEILTAGRASTVF